jgi:hypothetical protein
MLAGPNILRWPYGIPVVVRIGDSMPGRCIVGKGLADHCFKTYLISQKSRLIPASIES